MERTNELQKMMKWGKVLDVATNIISKILVIVCAIAIGLLVAELIGVLPEDFAVRFTLLGREIDYYSLSSANQNLLTIFMIAVCVLTIVLVIHLTKALRSVFQAIANGRPFEESAIKGFRRAALLIAIIGILSSNGYCLVIAAMFLFLSYIFHYGMILQQESDETL